MRVWVKPYEEQRLDIPWASLWNRDLVLKAHTIGSSLYKNDTSFWCEKVCIWSRFDNEVWGILPIGEFLLFVRFQLGISLLRCLAVQDIAQRFFYLQDLEFTIERLQRTAESLVGLDSFTAPNSYTVKEQYNLYIAPNWIEARCRRYILNFAELNLVKVVKGGKSVV